MSNLDKVIHQARGANREHAREAGCAVGQALDEHNTQVKKKKEKDYESELGEISKYHLDRATTNRTYH